MTLRAACRTGLALWAVATLVAGCTTVREVVGLPANDPSVELKSAEPKWLLIKNPRFGDVPSEPEYIWVEEDKVPTTMKTLVFGKSSLIAPPEVVAKYGSPPGGGRISPRQKMPYQLGNSTGSSQRPNGAAAVAPTAARNSALPAAVTPLPVRGYVVFIDTNRIVIDLTAKDGLRPGTTVSLRRDKIPIVHPVTGELLGELDEELATGKVTEVRDKFSVIEVQNLAPGVEI